MGRRESRRETPRSTIRTNEHDPCPGRADSCSRGSWVVLSHRKRASDRSLSAARARPAAWPRTARICAVMLRRSCVTGSATGPQAGSGIASRASLAMAGAPRSRSARQDPSGPAGRVRTERGSQARSGPGTPARSPSGGSAHRSGTARGRSGTGTARADGSARPAGPRRP